MRCMDRRVGMPTKAITVLASLALVAALGGGLYRLADYVLHTTEASDTQTPTYIADCGTTCEAIQDKLDEGVCEAGIQDCYMTARWMIDKFQRLDKRLESLPTNPLADPAGLRAWGAWVEFWDKCGTKEWNTGPYRIEHVAGQGNCNWVATTAIENTNDYLKMLVKT